MPGRGGQHVPPPSRVSCVILNNKNLLAVMLLTVGGVWTEHSGVVVALRVMCCREKISIRGVIVM